MKPVLDETHDRSAKSWVDSANLASADFPIQNLPFGVFRLQGNEARVGVAIGDRILDVAGMLSAGLLANECVRGAAEACASGSLNRLMALGTTTDLAAAEACYRQAIVLVPDFAEALANLGLLRQGVGAFAEAEHCLRRAVAIDPNCAQNHLNLGVLLAKLKHFAEAEAEYLDVLQRTPGSPVAWSNYGVLLASLKRDDEAENCYRTAMALDLNYAAARFNLAYIQLRQGRFEEGWESLESRDWYTMLSRYFTCPRWQGETLNGRTILIGLESGHGDMIQFCRYSDVLKTQGAAKISIICHPALKSLFSTLDSVDLVIALNEPLPSSHWDF